MLIDVLKLVGKHLNDQNIRWGIGGSVMLFAHGIVQTPRDIDLIIHSDDIKKAFEILSNLGKLKEKTSSESCASDYFYEFIIKSITIEIIAGFTIKHNEGLYIYKFDDTSTPEYLAIDNIQLPLMTIEDWYIMYQILPNRDKKISMIEGFLSTKGIKYNQNIENQLKLNLPKDVIRHTNKFLEFIK